MHHSTGPRPRFAAAGAGRMGRSIAIALAYAGHRISLVDLRVRGADAVRQLREQAHAEIVQSLRGLAALGALHDAQVEPIAARVEFVDAAGAAAALADVELVFEGVSEMLEAKRAAFEQLEGWCREDAVFASTTSSIGAGQLATMLARPERFLNMHWLNPAYLIPVVEIATHAGTAPEVLARAKALLERIGKLPVVCNDTPGYIVPRLQALVMNEAARMIEEGAATAQEIDKATRYGLGLRFAALGVVEFIDFGGVDILHHASREMSASIDAARYRAPANVDRLMAEGRLGLKTGSGFFDHGGRDADAYRQDVLSRVLAMLRQQGMWRAPSDETLG